MVYSCYRRFGMECVFYYSITTAHQYYLRTRRSLYWSSTTNVAIRLFILHPGKSRVHSCIQIQTTIIALYTMQYIILKSVSYNGGDLTIVIINYEINLYYKLFNNNKYYIQFTKKCIITIYTVQSLHIYYQHTYMHAYPKGTDVFK